jgi:hypothetical protein
MMKREKIQNRKKFQKSGGDSPPHPLFGKRRYRRTRYIKV